MSERVWMSHIQGFHGWAAGTIEHGIYTEYDGVQGGQTMLVQVIGAYLGMDAFLSEQEFIRHVPYYYRRFIDSVR